MACDDQYESARQAYNDNADYDIACSPAKAQAFIVAIRRLIGYAQSASNQSSSMSFDLAALQNQQRTAEAWLAANGSTGAGSGSGIGGGEFNCLGFAGYERGGYQR